MQLGDTLVFFFTLVKQSVFVSSLIRPYASVTLNSSSIAVTVSPGGGWVSFWMWAYRLRAGTSVLPQVAASSRASWIKMY